MNTRYLIGAAGACAILFTATIAASQTNDAVSSGPAMNGSPAWFLQDMSGMRATRAKPTADGGMAGCASDIVKYCSHTSGSTLRYCLLANAAKLSGQCKESAITAEATSLKRSLARPIATSRRSAIRRPSAAATGWA